MKLEYSGDGNSKDEAIYFTNANSFIDHINMQNEFIKQNDLDVYKRTVQGPIQSKYVYDVMDTSQGKLWFKVPGNMIE